MPPRSFSQPLYGGYKYAALEAPPEFGVLSGAYVGAWDNLQALYAIAWDLCGERPMTPIPAPDPPNDAESMARMIVRFNTIATTVIGDIKDLLRNRG